MALNVTPFVGTDNFNMETFNNMISQINSGVNSEISDVLAQLGMKAKIQTGSYVGTGTYGADNPCSLTFDKKPKALFISGLGAGSNDKYLTAVIIPDAPNTVESVSAASGFNLYIEYNNNTISWHGYGDAGYQANKEGYNYYYCAIL